MIAQALQSLAFDRASLKSESYRVVALLCVLVVLTVLVIVRGLTTQNYLLLIGQTIVLAFIIAHECVMLYAIRRALRDDSSVVPELWVFNVLIESQVPTVALFVLLLAQWTTPYQVLVAPAIVMYFLFITLSTLRLRPGLTFATGLLSAGHRRFLRMAELGRGRVWVGETERGDSPGTGLFGGRSDHAAPYRRQVVL